MGSTQKQERVLAQFQGRSCSLYAVFLFWKRAHDPCQVSCGWCSPSHGEINGIWKESFPILNGSVNFFLKFFVERCDFGKSLWHLNLVFLPFYRSDRPYLVKRWMKNKIGGKIWKKLRRKYYRKEHIWHIWGLQTCSYTDSCLHPDPCILPTCHDDSSMQHPVSPHSIICFFMLVMFI